MVADDRVGLPVLMVTKSGGQAIRDAISKVDLLGNGDPVLSMFRLASSNPFPTPHPDGDYNDWKAQLGIGQGEEDAETVQCDSLSDGTGGGVGRLYCDGKPSPSFTFEYLDALFGPKSSSLLDVANTLAVAEPASCCHELTGNDDKIAGNAILVKRGGCSFVRKLSMAQAAGASLVIVENNKPGMLRMGANRDELGGLGDDSAPAVMVPRGSGRILRGLSSQNCTVELVPELPFQLIPSQPETCTDGRVLPSMWSELTSLVQDYQVMWPTSAKERKRQYRVFASSHHPDRTSGNVERFKLLQFAYKRAEFLLGDDPTGGFDDDEY